MRARGASFLLYVAMVAGVLLVALMVLFGTGSIIGRAPTAVLIVVNLVIFADLWDVLARVYVRTVRTPRGGLTPSPGPSMPLDVGRFTPFQKRAHLKPYALVMSVHNCADVCHDFFRVMAPYKDRVWIIDDASTDDTCELLELGGFRCVRNPVNRKKPGAIRELLRTLPADIDTVVVMDPDMHIDNQSSTELTDLEEVIFDFQRSGAAAVCPRIAVKAEGILSRFQGFEYCMAQLLGRKSLAGISANSGVSIYRRDALEAVLQRHSLSVYAEDLENTLILLGAGEDIYFDDRLVIVTEGQPSVWRLFSQRVGWAFGHLRVYADQLANIRRIANRGVLSAYQYVAYLGVISLLLHPLRVFALLAISLGIANGLDALLGLNVVPDLAIADPRLFATTYYQYLVLCAVTLVVAVPAGERWRMLPIVVLYFPYALALIVPVTLGFANWVAVRLGGWRLFHDHYQDVESLVADTRARREVPAFSRGIG